MTGELADVLERADAVDEIVFVEDRAEYVEELNDADAGFIFGNARHGDVRQDANLSGADVVVSAAERTDVNRRLLEDAEDALTIVTAPTEAAATRLAEEGADYVVVGRGLVGAELADLLADLDDPDALESRLAALNDRARSGSPRLADEAAGDRGIEDERERDGGETDV
ncbi:NAD-binding protein [Natronolimnohabitans innermongolicus]|uniref:NAD-binding protein n=1 Tax=Natronolimnohabitans innermongolicus TaxID=253107 RepID=UPI001F4CE366|nr:NAD-binding protein [Natronolimnohabitans innermongolicus]